MSRMLPEVCGGSVKISLFLIVFLLAPVIIACQQRDIVRETSESMDTAPASQAQERSTAETFVRSTQEAETTLLGCEAPCWGGELIPGQTTQIQAEEVLPQITGFPSEQIRRIDGYENNMLGFSFEYQADILPAPDELGGLANLFFREDVLEIIHLRPFRKMSAAEIFEIYGEPDQILVTTSEGTDYAVDLLYLIGIRISMISRGTVHARWSESEDWWVDVNSNMELRDIQYSPPVSSADILNLFPVPMGWPNVKYDSKLLTESVTQWQGYGRYKLLWVSGPPERAD